MRFTEPQQQIIKEICAIENRVLRDLMVDPNLTEKLYNSTLKELLENHEATEGDWIETAGEAHEQFKRLYHDPSMLFELDRTCLSIFRQVLTIFEFKFKDKYPKAWTNLWNKIFVFGEIDEFKQLN